MVRASTIGAAASKNESDSAPTSLDSEVARASEHRGPAAMTHRPSGTLQTSPRTTSMRGLCSTSLPTRPEKTSLSTASAPPAGTDACLAHASSSLPIISSSSLRRPAAESRLVLLRELEQTSSAMPSVWCAAVDERGLCSQRRTRTPLLASCSAHSQPARPAPTTVTMSMSMSIRNPSAQANSTCTILPQQGLLRCRESAVDEPGDKPRGLVLRKHA